MRWAIDEAHSQQPNLSLAAIAKRFCTTGKTVAHWINWAAERGNFPFRSVERHERTKKWKT